MFLVTLVKHTAIAFARSKARLPLDEQIELADEFGCEHVYVDLGKGRMRVDTRGEPGKMFKGDARAEWGKALGTQRDTIAWVARLDVLVRPKAELPAKVMSSRDAATILLAAASKAHIVVEGIGGATSDLSTEWQRRVSWMMSRASGGVPRDIEKQREHGRRGAKAAIAASVRRRWKRKSMRAEFEKAKNIWCNVRDYPTRGEARAALPEELRGLSFVTLWRMFKGRT